MTRESRCLNCNAALIGEYCSHCGQRATGRELRFLDVAGDALRDLIDWDSRFWRTLLPLLFRPGFLTAEFIAGRRARYVPPFRLYLIVSFLLFLTISLGSNSPLEVSVVRDEATAAAQAPVESGSDGKSEAHQLRNVDLTLRLSDEDSPAWLRQLDQRLNANAERFHREPQVFLDKLLDDLPQLMFVMLPLFAGLLRLAYRAPFHYLQHLVFALHYHSFADVVYLLGLLLERALPVHTGLMSLLLILYLPLALRGTYGSGWAGAIGKSALILLGYSLLLGAGFIGTLAFVFAMA